MEVVEDVVFEVVFEVVLDVALEVLLEEVLEVVEVVMVLLLDLTEEQLEPGPEKALRQVAGSQWAKSVSHQPYWEPGKRRISRVLVVDCMIRDVRALVGWVTQAGRQKEWGNRKVTYSSFLRHISYCHTVAHSSGPRPWRQSREESWRHAF